jgi:NAD(P)-dependent dehydrogenase (short-subunit alcohol dehydrogenase family)
MPNDDKWTAEDIPDQSGKTAIVTGANSGLGFITARELAKHGAHVVLASRTESKAAAAKEAIEAEKPSGSVEVELLDLANLDLVKVFVSKFKEKHDKLDLLCNNAGVMAIPFQRTADGFEMQFGTNHFGHFALTAMLIERLLNTKNSRIVTVSSMAHTMGFIDFDNINAERKYSKWGAYAMSKLANLLFTYEAARRLERLGHDTIAVAAHPGYSATNLQNSMPFHTIINKLFAQDEEIGALSQLYACTAEEVGNGEYYGPDGFRGMWGHPKRVNSNRRSHDEDTAQRLWELSEKVTGTDLLN